jgi:EmrB/QacA subfamily drug resistance transporter
VLLVGIDMTAVNVALPSIGHDLHTNASGLTWIIDAYTLALATLLMLSSSMADRFGRRLVFRIGLATFALGSALCAVAPDLGFLVGARVIQGAGGSMLNPVAMAVIASVFTDRVERARAIGVWAGVTGLSLAIGPIVGGALVGSSLGWRWIFVINVPIGLAAIAVATKVVPESKAAHARKIDLGGQALIALTLATLVFGVIEGPKLGWASPAIIATLTVAAAALAGFIGYESRAAEPLLDLRFFRSIPFSAANLIAVFSFASLGSFLYINSIYLQDARGYGPLRTGLLMVPLAIVSALWGPRNGRILGKFGARIPFVVAGVAVMAASAILSQATLTTPLAWLLLAYALIGLGNSSSSGPITQLAVAGMPPEQAGVAAGVSATTRQIGQTIGVAIAGVTLASTATGSHAQLATATHTGWILMGTYGLAVLALGLAGTTGLAKRTAERALPTATSSPAPAGPNRA